MNLLFALDSTTFEYILYAVAFIVALVVGIVYVKKRKQRAAVARANYEKLAVGMSKTEIIAILGEPTDVSTEDGVLTLIWKRTEFNNAVAHGTMQEIITAEFKDDIMTKFDKQTQNLSSFK